MDVLSFRQLRMNKGFTVAALARRAGVSLETVRNVEHTRRAPRVGTMHKLATALGVEPRDVAEFRRVIDGEGAGGG